MNWLRFVDSQKRWGEVKLNGLVKIHTKTIQNVSVVILTALKYFLWKKPSRNEQESTEIMGSAFMEEFTNQGH